MFEVDDLSKAFHGVKAVDGVSFKLAKGSITSLIGPNGAGKTTLINMVTGVIAPTRGSITFKGQMLTGLRPHAIAALGVRRFALGTPYPAAIHAIAPPFFRSRGFELTGDATLDILAMRDVPKVDGKVLARFVDSLPKEGAQAVVLLATDLPSFGSLDALEQACGCPVLTSNQVILWAALRAAGVSDQLPGMGRLMSL